MDYYSECLAKLDKLRNRDDYTVLAFESSCDETAVAVTRGRKVLSSVISSQIEIHKRFGGVVPEIASRNHILAIGKITDEALAEAGITLKDVDVVAVTYGAGLLGALLVGVSYAKSLAYSLGVPLIAVNHIKGHMAANYISEPGLEPPYICLLASGGHTYVLEVNSIDDLRVLGETQDDAVGEAFDKVARVLGLPYPGGPEIEKKAKEGKAVYALPRAYKGEKHLNFSYSGLKTAVINLVSNAKARHEEINAADLAASFQKEAVDVLVDHTGGRQYRVARKSYRCGRSRGRAGTASAQKTLYRQRRNDRRLRIRGNSRGRASGKTRSRRRSRAVVRFTPLSSIAYFVY